MANGMISLKDIALRCDVSSATVSKALNGRGGLSEETRLRICRVAEEMGYQSNFAARALKTNRTHNLGVLFEEMSGLGMTHEFFASVLEGFKTEATKRGYDITFISKSQLDRSSTYLQYCRYRCFDGVVIICVDFFDSDVLELIRSEIPIATVDHVYNNRISVISDNLRGIETLVRYAYEKGHRKLAYIYGNETSVTQNRLTGFHRACEELGLQINPLHIRQSHYYDANAAYEAAAAILSLRDRPSCILFPDDFSLIGGMRAIHDAGLKIPEDISVMGYDGIIISQVMTPRITTYHQNSNLIGKTAAEKLIELIDHPNTAVLDRFIVKGELLEGESVRQL